MLLLCICSRAWEMCGVREAVPSHVFCMYRRQAWSLQLVHVLTPHINWHLADVDTGAACVTAATCGSVFQCVTHCMALKGRTGTGCFNLSVASRLVRSVTAGLHHVGGLCGRPSEAAWLLLFA
jgi:hypothetical protein